MSFGGDSGGHDSAKTPTGGFDGLEAGAVEGARGSGTTTDPLIIPGTTETSLINEALEDLGLDLASETMLWWFHPFYAKGIADLVVTGAPSSLSAVAARQAVVVADTAGNVIYSAGANAFAGGPGQMFVAGAAKKFWMAGFFRPANSIAGDDRGGMSAYDGSGNRQLFIGAHGTTHATKYVMAATVGAAIVDTSSVVHSDNAFHKVKGWRDGTDSWLKVDSNPAVSGTARPQFDCAPVPVDVTSVAAQRNCAYVWAAYATVLET